MFNVFPDITILYKKLLFGVKKCKKLHIGNMDKEYKCQDFSVDKWEEVELINDETEKMDLRKVGLVS